MESWSASASLKVRPVVDHVEKARSDLVTDTPIVGNKDISQSADFKSNSLTSKLGKRKRHCELSRCSYRATSPLRNYERFMKSGPLSRLLYHQDGDWVNFPTEATELVRKKFQRKHAVVEVELYDSRFILDVLYMRILDISTGKHMPIAWIDDAGSCFFPEIYDDFDKLQGICHFDSHEKSHAQDINLYLQIEVNGAIVDRVDENTRDVPALKKIRVGQSLSGYDSDSGSSDDNETGDSRLVGCGNNVMDGSYANLESVSPKKSRNVLTELHCANNDVHYDVDVAKVCEMFSAGMSQFSCPTVVEIKGVSGKTMQNRLELFKKVIENTEKFRGSSNLQYAWLPCSRKDVSAITTYGFGLGGIPSTSAYGYGVHLSSKSYAYASVNNCDDDENGIRHMLLCRVVLGNVEPVHLGSDQFCPSSDQFDTGVDDILDPHVHIVWEANALTHIYPQYVVSFKLKSRPEEAFGAQVRVSEVSGVTNAQAGPQLQFGLSNASGLNYQPGTHFKNEYHGCATTFGSSSPKLPNSSWMPFPLLFDVISKQVPPETMRAVDYHYYLFKCKKSIDRNEFVKRLRIAVGDTLLKSAVTSLRCKLPTSPCPTNLEAPKPELEA
ncbi:unnamed protein product [Rhodiola kirilowii]